MEAFRKEHIRKEVSTIILDNVNITKKFPLLDIEL
jgi:hypothetical protein